MPCLDCLDDSKTLIPEPICQNGCPDDVGCTDIINSNCVIVNPELSCINKTSGITLSVALQAIDSKLCQSISNLNACKVKVNAQDQCCDYLGNKIDVSGGLLKVIEADEANENCSLLTIKHPEWLYNNITLSDNRFIAGNINPYSFTTPQVGGYYRSTSGNYVHEVKLRGTIVAQLNQLTTPVQTTITIGNINNILLRPTVNKLFSGNYISPTGSFLIFYNLSILTNGNIQVSIVHSGGGGGDLSRGIISLDGLNYSI